MSNSKTTCFTMLCHRLTMGKAAEFAGKTSCFTSMTLYDTSRKRVICSKHFGIRELATKYDTLPKINEKSMAIHIRLIKNNIKSSSSYGKYFAKSVSQGDVTLRDMLSEALMARGYDRAAVVTVVTDLEHALKVKLSDGYTVVLPGIGRFSLRVESEGVSEPKEFSLRRHIKRIVCGFLPAGRRTFGHNIVYNFCEGVNAVWQKGCKP